MIVQKVERCQAMYSVKIVKWQNAEPKPLPSL